MADLKISNLTSGQLTPEDYIPVARSGANYKINLQAAIVSESRVYYPESYGALRDGSTNDRVAIQAAIDACYSAGGGIVQLSAGTYRVQPTSNTCIVLKTGVHLKGLGIGVTIVETDNTSSTAIYNLITSYLWNTATSPYTAHELHVSDMTVRGTSFATSGNAANLHNLIAFCHCPKGLIERVGFDLSSNHFAEFNQSKNCSIVDCETVGAGNHGTSKFQLDPSGSAGGISSSARIAMTITNSATYSGGLTTLLTVNSTAGVSTGDLVIITSANGTAASAYNSTGGWVVTNVVSATQVAINMPWPTSVATPATTAGTATVQTWVADCSIVRYTDKARSDTTFTPARTFLDLSHNGSVGCYKNFSLLDSYIISPSATAELGSSGTYTTIAFDSGAYPYFFDGLTIKGNLFTGGTTSQNDVIWIPFINNTSLLHRRMSRVTISDNVFRDIGCRFAIMAGGWVSDTAPRSPSGTAITEHAVDAVYDITIENNKIYPVCRTGALLWQTRVSRVIGVGACKSAVIRNNTIHWRDKSPDNWIKRTFSSIDLGSDQVTLTASHPWATGQEVVIHSTASYPTGLSTNTLYLIVVSSTVVKFATSYANAIAETAIDITGSGSGTITVSSGWGYAGASQTGFRFEHVQNLIVENNSHIVELTSPDLAIGFHPFSVGCSAFEMPSYSTSITGAATDSSGLRTSLTVTSTASFKAGDRVYITSANGTDAAAYNRVGGHIVTAILTGTTMSISLPWQGNATTAGTVATSKRPFKGSVIFTNNVVEVGPNTPSNMCYRPFAEWVATDTTPNLWASSITPSVAGIWKGNYAVTYGSAFPADTAGGAPHLNVGAQSATSSVTTAAESDSTLTKGRHRWGYGPRGGTGVLSAGTITINDALVTANSIININRSTDGGTIGSSYSVTRTAGTSFTVTSKEANVTQTLDTSTISYLITEPN